MSWTLLVPGALLPAALAPEITRALRAPRLAEHLAAARPAAVQAAAERHAGAAHLSWLAQRYGLPEDLPAAPYAWRAADRDGPAAQPAWVAFCEPVHVLVGRERLRLLALAPEALQPDEDAALLALANEAAAGSAALGLRFERRGGRWYAGASAPLRLDTWPLEAVLGRSLAERQPGGAQARAWRVLSNEIQMMWHASAVNEAREARGARTANALWLHGGGAWRALPAHGLDWLRTDALPGLDGVLQGWHAAGASTAAVGGLAVHGGLFAAWASQDWDAWLAAVPAWEGFLEQELARARAAGAGQIELVLGGTEQTRSLRLPLRAPWWQRWRPAGEGAGLAQRLAEAAADAGAGRTGTALAAHGA
jgi:hypothetical protein